MAKIFTASLAICSSAAPKKDRQRFEYGHFGAKAAPDAAHLEADHARADDAEFFRCFRNGKRTGIGEHQFFVKRRAGQGARAGTGGNDDVPAFDRLRALARHINAPELAVAAAETAAPVKKLDLVLLEQEQNAVVVLLHDLVLACLHFADIDVEALDLDAVLAELVSGVLKVFRRLQQGFRWNATDVGAGAAGRGFAGRRAPFVYAGCFETQLCGANGSNIAAGAAPDNDDIECVCHDEDLKKRATEIIEKTEKTKLLRRLCVLWDLCG